MQVSDHVIRQLDIKGAAKFCIETPLDRMPMLISDRAHGGSRDLLAKWVQSSFLGGQVVPTEVITMPKSKYGQRPVICTSLASRVLYQALVDAIRPGLGPSSREGDAWERHEEFSTSPTKGFVVTIDIAACYEFVDHERLRREVVALTLNHSIANAITEYLGECSPNNRGLPQLTAASDVLADAYLNILERQIARNSLAVSRYADDFSVRAASWEEATTTIEYAAEYARDIGLILAYEKTKVDRAGAFRERRRARESIQRKYFNSEKQRAVFYKIAGRGAYGEGTVDSIKVGSADIAELKNSMWKVLNEWKNLAAEQQTKPEEEGGRELALRRLAPLALAVLEDDKRRVSDDVLIPLVTREPIRLERVCKYLLARSSSQEELKANWSTLYKLTRTTRMSPWARIWILHLAGTLPQVDTDHCSGVEGWTTDRVIDRHEVVRAEAAWTLAGFGVLQSDVLLDVLKDATPISQAGVAAAIGRQGDLSAGLVKSVTSESPLLKAAHDWGEKNQ